MCSRCRALILAAGRGSRLGDLTSKCPKALVKIADRTLLEMAMRSLAGAGIGEIALVCGYRGEQLATIGATVFKNHEWEETGIYHSALAASDWLSAGVTVLSYSDIFYGADVVQRLCVAPHDIAVAYDPNAVALWSLRFQDPISDLENFRLDETKTFLRSVGGRPESLADVQGQYMGLIKLTPRGWEQLRAAASRLSNQHRRLIDFTSLLSTALDMGTLVGVVENREAWGEVDHRSDILLYEQLYF